MSASGEVRECWFLTGSQHLYGDETLQQVAAQAAQIVAALNAAPELSVPIVGRPVLTTAAEIRRVCLDASADDRCIGVVAWMHTFSPAKAWIAGLEALRKPFLHLHTQANLSLPWDQIDMDFMNLNQSAHGDREFGHITARLGLRRKIVVGHVGERSVREHIGAWLRAASGWHASQNLQVARFGDNMREVAVTDGDRVEAQRRFGYSVLGHGVGELAAAVDAIPDSAVEDLIAEYLERYAVAPRLQRSGDRHESLRDAARIELGLRGFLAQGGFGAFTTNFQDLTGLRQLPGIAAQRLMADGYGFGAEGDWKTAALLHTLKAMGDGLPGGTSFMEDYTYHLGPGEPRVLGAHMLEVCPSISAQTPSCEIHPLSIGGREDPVRLVFDAPPGSGWVVGILHLGDRFRLVANEVEIVEPDAPLRRLPVARAAWEPKPDLAISAECWIRAGGPHHTVLSTAVPREALEDLATIAGVELAWIDARTDAREFARELNWNGIYHRLEQGAAGR